MSRRLAVLGCLFILVLVASAAVAGKDRTRVVRLDNVQPKLLRTSPNLVAADTCVVIHFDSLVWLINGWVIGDEIYKAYLDPAASCTAPYPFTVTSIHIIMGFGGPTPLLYGVDIEDVDYSDPDCPVPDTLIAVSPNYQDQVPAADIYDIWVDLDPPVVVNGPFFGGFYLGGGIDPYSAPALVTDDDSAVCTSYNIWDDSLGFVDLNDNPDYCFPGKLAMYAVGYTGGGQSPPQLAAIGNRTVDEKVNLNFTISASDPNNDPITLTMTSNDLPPSATLTDHGNGTGTFSWTPDYGDAGVYSVTFSASDGTETDYETIQITVLTANPPPELIWLSPDYNSILLGSAQLWVFEKSGPEGIEYVSFEYSTGGGYIEIGRDFDGSSPLRDGATYAVGGNGFSLTWDFSGLAEGSYKLRATAYDTLGQSGSDSVTVYLEPTPPVARIVSPDNASVFCNPLELLMVSSDEDLSYVEIHRQQAQYEYSAGLGTLSTGGSGSHHNGPVAAALAVKLWFDRGYASLMREDMRYLTVAELADNLAAEFNTDMNLGTYDENLYQGLKDYFLPRGNLLAFDFKRNPDYFSLRTWVEEEQRAVIIALNGMPGVWLAVDGFAGWTQLDNSYIISVSDPLAGAIVDLPMRNSFGSNQVYFNGSWQTLDKMVSLQPHDWSVSRNLVGADLNGADGWSFTWTPYGVVEDDLCFFRTRGYDAADITGVFTILMKYGCAQFYTAGDYNNDQDVNIMDLVYLIEFLTAAGPPPVGGAERADANGDGYVNIADVVYYMNFLFGGAAPPAH